ncbi:MAG: PIN domain-containing protein [Opitutaceae bacterium]
MKYLLDVNALIGWRHARSPHHLPFHVWASRVGLRNLYTSAHTELGFLRVSMQAFDYTLDQAQLALADLKAECGGFVDEAPSPKLAAWATSAGRTTDAYLTQLAAQHGLTLATFDRRIPDSALIA